MSYCVICSVYYIILLKKNLRQKTKLYKIIGKEKHCFFFVSLYNPQKAIIQWSADAESWNGIEAKIEYNIYSESDKFPKRIPIKLLSRPNIFKFHSACASSLDYIFFFFFLAWVNLHLSYFDFLFCLLNNNKRKKNV